MSSTVLVANGDHGLCGVYRELLSERGYFVRTALDALDCLEKLRRAPPALLVLDLELRWGGGDGVLAWLREEGAESAVTVILTASRGYPAAVAADTRPPVVGFLPGPFGPMTLLESVNVAIAAGIEVKVRRRFGLVPKGARPGNRSGMPGLQQIRNDSGVR